jgi:3-hydroxyacyl-[acyl-carrier-protein] dehydratase
MIRDEIEKTALADIKMSGPDSGSQKFCPAADFIGFNGHFPDYPILPAMLQVLFGVLVSEKIMRKKLILKKLDKAKFMLQIKPEEMISVTCKIIQTAPDRTETGIKAKVTITVAEKKAASMTLFLEPA